MQIESRVARRRLRLRHIFGAIAVSAVLVAPEATSGTAAATADGELGVSSVTFAGQSISAIFLQSSEVFAKAAVFVPQGYTLKLGRAEGSAIGRVWAFVDDAAGSFSVPAQGELVSADPSRYSSDPIAQACAAGTHAAVWRASLAVPGRTLELAVFVDPASASSPAGSAYALTLCPVWPSSTVGVAHLVADGVALFIDEGLQAPSASGRYVWSALVTPTHPGSLDAAPSRAFEVRSLVAIPRVRTLRSKHDAPSQSVVLSGRLLTLGQPEAGVSIGLTAYVPSTEDFILLATSGRMQPASSRFVRVDRTTKYTASVSSQLGSCTAPSNAPGGCVSETVAPPAPAQAAVIIRKRTDPKLAVRRQNRAHAREANFRLGDFPPGWFSFPLLTPLKLCPKLAPDLSALTATGEARSPVFTAADLSTDAFSSSTVYATETQARTAFDMQAVRAVADCVADDARERGATVLSVGRLSFPRLGHQTRAFRVVVSDRSGAGMLDLVSFRRGRTVVHLAFSSLVGPLDIERSLAAKVAARARAR